MDKKIKELEQISLSTQDINNLLNGKVNIITYGDLAAVNNINQILDPYDACVIIYLTREHYGHWVCLIKLPKKSGGVKQELEFFDSYGQKPDSQLDWNIDEYIRVKNNQDYPHLTWLLYNSKYDITYNQYKFQKKEKDVRTCGRHVTVRILCKNFSLNQYKKLMLNTDKEHDPDWIVTFITSVIM